MWHVSVCGNPLRHVSNEEAYCECALGVPKGQKRRRGRWKDPSWVDYNGWRIVEEEVVVEEVVIR